MKIIVCLDDSGGMLFNKRRQSSDEELCKRVLKKAENTALWMNEYSAKLFTGHNICVDDCFFEKAQKGDYCFVENADISSCLKKAEEITVYRWNRRYPSDVKFPIEILSSLRLVSSEKFKGKSHPEITEEVYSVEK